MRFNEALCQSMPPMHFGLQNNNQLQRSSSELITNEKNESLSHDTENRDFYIGRETSNYASVNLANRINNKIHEHNLNNNLDNAYNQSSSVESLADLESYCEESEDQLEPEPEEEPDGSDSEYSEDGNLPAGCRGIVNPNYPGFQHLGPSLLSDTDDTDEDEVDLEDDESLGEDPVREDEYNNNSNNNNNLVGETINRLESHIDEEKQLFYEKPKFNLQRVDSLIECINYAENAQSSSDLYDQGEVEIVQLTTSVKEILQFAEIEKIPDSSKNSEVDELEEPAREEQIDLIREANAVKRPAVITTNPFLPTYASTNPFHTSNILNNNDDNLEDILQTVIIPEPVDSCVKLDEIDLLANIKNRGSPCNEDQQDHHQQVASVPDVVGLSQEQMHHVRRAERKDNNFEDAEDNKEEQVVPVNAVDEKKEKMLRNQARKRQQQARQDNRRRHEIEAGSFDVYNIETAMPKIDMDAIENHLKAAREEERRRRTDREEIRRRLAMGPDADDLRNEKGRKPSLQSRLQSGMNLQICFMNDTSSDTDSIHGFNAESNSVFPSESPSYSSSASSSAASSTSCSPKKLQAVTRPQVLSLPTTRVETGYININNKKQSSTVIDEADFFARQARLQTEARMALAQAKEMAHMQMEVERQKLKQNPITEMVRDSLEKIGVNLGEERRRMTRGLLTDLNIAQLQVLANDLHARIATLNEVLVEGLLRRDDLHMEQDSMLVDVEDLTRYLGAKEESMQKEPEPVPQLDAKKIQKPTPIVASYTRRINTVKMQKQLQQKVLGRSLAILDRAGVGRQLVANLVRK